VGAFPGGAETDCLAFATSAEPFDIPWLSEDPITATVPSESMMNVDLTLTTVVTDPLPLGTYHGLLRVRGNDPLVQFQDVLVIMHVVEAYEPPVPSFTSNAPVTVGEQVDFVNTTVPGIPPATTYLWDLGDLSTSTLENPTHVYDTWGTYMVSLEACNEAGCATYSDWVEVNPLQLFLPALLRNH
jgi:PKD repeat protein